jgi:hypothetical protein
MSTAMVPASFGALSTKFANKPIEDDISAGIQAGFGLIGYKGKVWSTRYRGTITPLMRPDGDGPRGSIEVVVLKAPRAVSKVFYEGGWVDGSSEAPDCFSTNGVVPEPGVNKKQGNTCALCEKNKWGSRVTDAGNKGKACSDSKRLAIVPLQDLNNEALGGPMLLRVPAASLAEFASFDEKMRNLGYPYYSYGMRIAFDASESYPKFTFTAIRPLTDAEADIVLALREGQSVTRILAEGAEHAKAQEEAATAPSPFEQAQAKAAPNPTTGQASTKPAPVAVKPVTTPASPKPNSPPPPSGTAAPATSQTGFGSPAPAKGTDPTSSPVSSAQPTTGTDSSVISNEDDFDAALDAKMNELLPTTSQAA